MKINLCIPTRGKPDRLIKYAIMDIENSTLDDTRIVIGVDEDDDATNHLRPKHPKMTITVNAREDSLGAKYNRCATDVPADLYVMGMDDVGIKTKGWDAILADAASQLPDGLGVMYFGTEPHGEALPSMMAVTAKFVETVGYFCPPLFPFWWNNTWVDEVAQMAGRAFRAPIETAYPEDFPPPARRDIAFWQTFFDATFQMREQAAERVIAASSDPEWRKSALRESRYLLVSGFEARGACLRDPKFVSDLEQHGSLQAPLDARHQRLRERAHTIMRSLVRVAA